MMSRRILIFDRGGVPALVVSDEVFAAPTVGSSDMVVRTSYSLVDPEALRAGQAAGDPIGALIGTVERGSVAAGLSPGDTVVGVGPLADRVVLQPISVQRLQGSNGLGRTAQTLLPIFSAVLGALRDVRIEPGDRVMVCGGGLIARVAGRLAQISSGMPPWLFYGPQGPDRSEGRNDPASLDAVDVLIDTTAAPALWAPALERVRREGRVLLLTPPGVHACRFDFYPGVHRRSLSLLARRVPAGQPPLVTEDAYRLFPRFLGHGSETSEDWFVEFEAAVMPSDALPVGKGLVIRWL